MLDSKRKHHTTPNLNLTPSQFGISVDVNNNGDIIAIGANTHDNNKGLATAYKYDGNEWQNIFAITGNSNQNTGRSVSLDGAGCTIAVGSPSLSSPGQTDVYSILENNQFQNLGTSINGENAYRNNSGHPVCISKNTNTDSLTLVISDFFNDEIQNNAGKVRVYDWTGDDIQPCSRALPCFAINTPILTNQGTIQIQNLTSPTNSLNLNETQK